jgi:hypothetical protein
MNEFLIECSFKSYNIAPKFDPMILHYAIFDPALCRIAQDLHTNSRQKSPALCGIARDHDPALCGIERDQHIFVNFSANSIRIRNILGCSPVA